MIVVMAIVGVTIFCIMRMAPGDPVAILAGDAASQAQLDEVRRALGLDQPVIVQFFLWAQRMTIGDFGTSIASREPVIDLILQRMEPTLALALVTLIVAASAAVAAGVFAAARAGTWIDRSLMGLSVIGFSMPTFVIGYILVYIFAVQLKWLPVQGYSPLSSGVGDWIRSLILPASTLGLAYLALIARVVRASMVEILAEDYIRTAVAKGVPPSRLLFRHALKNGGVPIITVIAIGLSLLIGGVVVTETVFNLPGMGRLVVDAISKRDYPVIQSIVVIFSGIYVLINLVVDLSYVFIDPRIKY